MPIPRRGSCSVADCSATTTGRKLYCIDHLDRMPYVRGLMAEIARRERTGADDGAGTADDIVEHLERHGAVTFGQLARAVHVSVEKLEPCLETLAKAGVVRLASLSTQRKRLKLVSLAG